MMVVLIQSFSVLSAWNTHLHNVEISQYRIVQSGLPKTTPIHCRPHRFCSMKFSSTSLQNQTTSDNRYVCPTLGRFVVADVELNLPIQQKGDASSGWWTLFRNKGRSRQRRNREAEVRPAAGLGAIFGFLLAGPFGALLGAAASASAVRRRDTVGDAARTASKAAGLAWDMSAKALETVGNSSVGDALRVGVKSAEKIVDSIASTKETKEPN